MDEVNIPEVTEHASNRQFGAQTCKIHVSCYVTCHVVHIQFFLPYFALHFLLSTFYIYIYLNFKRNELICLKELMFIHCELYI